MLRVMIDANILVAGTGWPRFPYEVLQHALNGDYQLVLTERIIQEAIKAIQQIQPERLAALNLFLQSGVVEIVPTPSDEAIAQAADLIRDPKDIHVALAAIEAKVDFLVTQDRDFTDRDATTEKLHAALNIILPGAFLREQLGRTSDALEIIKSRTWRDLQP